MTNDIKKAFHKIQAEEQLKQRTLENIYEKQSNRVNLWDKFKIKKTATVLACLLPLFAIGFLSYNTYFTQAAYIDVDINPSIELSVNRFDRIIDVKAYNEDGKDLLAELDLKNQKLDSALPQVIETTAREGQLQKERLISVTVQTKRKKEEKLVNNLKDTVDQAVSQYRDTEVEIYPVSQKVKTVSHEEHVSPAKYLAIMDLKKVDPKATVSGCRHHSIGNIKKLTDEHGGDHTENRDEKGSTSGHHASKKKGDHEENKSDHE